jgi:hypothetical protein
MDFQLADPFFYRIYAGLVRSDNVFVVTISVEQELLLLNTKKMGLFPSIREVAMELLEHALHAGGPIFFRNQSWDWSVATNSNSWSVLTNSSFLSEETIVSQSGLLLVRRTSLSLEDLFGPIPEPANQRSSAPSVHKSALKPLKEAAPDSARFPGIHS